MTSFMEFMIIEILMVIISSYLIDLSISPFSLSVCLYFKGSYLKWLGGGGLTQHNNEYTFNLECPVNQRHICLNQDQKYVEAEGNGP